MKLAGKQDVHSESQLPKLMNLIWNRHRDSPLFQLNHFHGVTFFLRYRLQPTATEAANQRARKSIERAAHVQFDQIF
jgi:hypothetical protein